MADYAARSCSPVKFPVPLSKHNKINLFDFSFSGLKSSVSRYIANSEITVSKKQDISAGFQISVCSHISNRLNNTLEYLHAKKKVINGVVLSGGVGCNSAIQIWLLFYLLLGALKLPIGGTSLLWFLIPIFVQIMLS